MTCRAAAASSPKAVTSSAARPLAAFRPSPASQAQQHEVLGPGQVVVGGGGLAGQRDPAAHRVRLPGHVVAEHPGRPGVGRQQGGEDPYRGGLARPVRPEQPVDGPRRHRQVEAVQRPAGPEPLGEGHRLDRQRRRPTGARLRDAHALLLSALFSYTVVKAKLSLTMLSRLRRRPRADQRSRSPGAGGSDPTPGTASPPSWAPRPRRCGRGRTRAWTTSPGPPGSAGRPSTPTSRPARRCWTPWSSGPRPRWRRRSTGPGWPGTAGGGADPAAGCRLAGSGAVPVPVAPARGQPGPGRRPARPGPGPAARGHPARPGERRLRPHPVARLAADRGAGPGPGRRGRGQGREDDDRRKPATPCTTASCACSAYTTTQGSADPKPGRGRRPDRPEPA